MSKESKNIILYWGRGKNNSICFFVKNRLMVKPIPCKPKDLEKTIMSIVELVDRRK